MDLATFINLSNTQEREKLCDLTGTTIGYLRKIASNGGGASSSLAFQIEQASVEISRWNRIEAKRHKSLRPVDGISVCSNTQKYQKFVDQIRSASA